MIDPTTRTPASIPGRVGEVSASLIIAQMGAQATESGSQQTHCWREAGSNSRSHSKRALHGREATQKPGSYKFEPSTPSLRFVLIDKQFHRATAHAGWTGYATVYDQ